MQEYKISGNKCLTFTRFHRSYLKSLIISGYPESTWPVITMESMFVAYLSEAEHDERLIKQYKSSYSIFT